MPDKIEVPERFSIASLFAEMLGSPRKSIKILNLKDSPMKVDYSISDEDFQRNCERYAEQREDSYKAIYNMIALEQKVFLTSGYVDINLRKRLKGIELSDNVRVKSIVSAVVSSYSRGIIYDDEIVYDYLWTLSRLNRKATCVVGNIDKVKAIASLSKCRGLAISEPDLRTFPIKDFWDKNLWVLKNGANVALI